MSNCFYITWRYVSNEIESDEKTLCQYFYSGLLVGWASLVYILKEEGIYGDLCDDEVETEAGARFEYVSGFSEIFTQSFTVKMSDNSTFKM